MAGPLDEGAAADGPGALPQDGVDALDGPRICRLPHWHLLQHGPQSPPARRGLGGGLGDGCLGREVSPTPWKHIFHMSQVGGNLYHGSSYSTQSSRSLSLVVWRWRYSFDILLFFRFSPLEVPSTFVRYFLKCGWGLIVEDSGEGVAPAAAAAPGAAEPHHHRHHPHPEGLRGTALSFLITGKGGLGSAHAKNRRQGPFHRREFHVVTPGDTWDTNHTKTEVRS